MDQQEHPAKTKVMDGRKGNSYHPQQRQRTLMGTSTSAVLPNRSGKLMNNAPYQEGQPKKKSKGMAQ